MKTAPLANRPALHRSAGRCRSDPLIRLTVSALLFAFRTSFHRSIKNQPLVDIIVAVFPVYEYRKMNKWVIRIEQAGCHPSIAASHSAVTHRLPGVRKFKSSCRDTAFVGATSTPETPVLQTRIYIGHKKFLDLTEYLSQGGK